MKRLVVVLALLLNGCALYDAYTMAHYDGDEYGQIVDIRVTAHEGAAKCGNPAKAIDTAKDLAKKTLAFQFFEEHIPSNNNGYNAAKSLNEIAQGLVVRYNTPPVPLVFCKIKFESIEHSAAVVQHVIGNRPR